MLMISNPTWDMLYDLWFICTTFPHESPCPFFGETLPANTTEGLGAPAHLTFQYLQVQTVIYGDQLWDLTVTQQQTDISIRNRNFCHGNRNVEFHKWWSRLWKNKNLTFSKDESSRILFFSELQRTTSIPSPGDQNGKRETSLNRLRVKVQLGLLDWCILEKHLRYHD